MAQALEVDAAGVSITVGSKKTYVLNIVVTGFPTVQDAQIASDKIDSVQELQDICTLAGFDYGVIIITVAPTFASPSPIPAVSPSQDQTDAGGSGGGAGVAIGVGVGCAVVVAMAAAMMVVRRKRQESDLSDDQTLPVKSKWSLPSMKNKFKTEGAKDLELAEYVPDEDEEVVGSVVKSGRVSEQEAPPVEGKWNRATAGVPIANKNPTGPERSSSTSERRKRKKIKSEWWRKKSTEKNAVTGSDQNVDHAAEVFEIEQYTDGDDDEIEETVDVDKAREHMTEIDTEIRQVSTQLQDLKKSVDNYGWDQDGGAQLSQVSMEEKSLNRKLDELQAERDALFAELAKDDTAILTSPLPSRREQADPEMLKALKQRYRALKTEYKAIKSKETGMTKQEKKEAKEMKQQINELKGQLAALEGDAVSEASEITMS
jgi:hypothetical protein